MIIPAITELNFDEVRKKVSQVDSVAKLIHIDIADGILVDGKTFLDIEELTTIQTSAEFELHLMVENPITFVEKRIMNITHVCAQIETELYIDDYIRKARENVYRVGLSLNPETNVEEVAHFIEKIDYVQFMTVKPGRQGRPFDSSVLNKIKEFRSKYPDKPCQADGGINKNTLSKLVEAGVDNAVVGSAIVKSENPQKSFSELNLIIEKGSM